MRLPIVRYWIVTGCALATVACQNHTQDAVYGTVDGRPIPDRVFADTHRYAAAVFKSTHNREPATAADEQEIEVSAQKALCSHLRSAIDRILRQEQVERFGVMVTSEDLDEQRKLTQLPDPKKMRDHAAAAVAAFAALNNGEDPKQVYEQMVKPHGIDEYEWNAYLMNRKTEAGRAQIRMELNMTDETLALAKSNLTELLTDAARFRKLDNAVDEQIASTDPMFRQYLNEWREKSKDPDPGRRWMPVDHKEYLDQVRAKWWKDRLTHVKVALKDPSLIQRCAVREMGVQIVAMQ